MLSAIHEQDEAVRFLSRALDGSFTSPLLLVGTEGTGRRFAIRHLTQELFCQAERTESCPCADCLQVRQNVHPDFVELAATDKDIGIDAIRAVVEAAYSTPSMAPYRVFLVDGADRMTPAAGNSLLKTLEEPPPSTRFFLLAESASAVLPTIRSRCGVVAFRPMSERYVLSKISSFESDSVKALVYTRMGEGSVGRSIQFWGAGRLALRDRALSALRLAVAKDIAGLFSLIGTVEKELPLLLRFTDHLLHDLFMINVAPEKLINLDVSTEIEALKQRRGDAVWQSLRQRLWDVRLTYQRVKINLPFHVKTILVDTFVG